MDISGWGPRVPRQASQVTPLFYSVLVVNIYDWHFKKLSLFANPLDLKNKKKH